MYRDAFMYLIFLATPPHPLQNHYSAGAAPIRTTITVTKHKTKNVPVIHLWMWRPRERDGHKENDKSTDWGHVEFRAQWLGGGGGGGR